MNMHSILRYTLKAYRPLYLHGLLRDGSYPRPAAETPNRSAAPRQRLWLVALTGLLHHPLFRRSSS
jgi:hypothetical protein